MYMNILLASMCMHRIPAVLLMARGEHWLSWNWTAAESYRAAAGI